MNPDYARPIADIDRDLADYRMKAVRHRDLLYGNLRMLDVIHRRIDRLLEQRITAAQRLSETGQTTCD